MPYPSTKAASREPSWLAITVIILVALAGATYFVLMGRPPSTALVKLSEPVQPSSPPPREAKPLAARFADVAEMRTWLLQADATEDTPVAGAGADTLNTPAAGRTVADAARLQIVGTRLIYAGEPKATAKKKSLAAGTVRLVKAWPTEELNLAATLDQTGSLVVAGDTLVILAEDGLYAYDIKDEKRPKATWRHALAAGQSVRAARVMGDSLLVLLGASLTRSAPCPIAALDDGAAAVSVPCDRVWHAATPAKADLALTALVLDLSKGTVGASAATVGHHASLAFTLGPQSLYVSVAQPADQLALVTGFLKENRETVGEALLARLERLRGYDLSPAARQMELEAALAQWQAALADNDRLKLQQDLAARLANYAEGLRHDAEQTAVLRFDAATLELAAAGLVPGHLVSASSWSADADRLRLAVAVGDSNALTRRFGKATAVPVTDLYVLGGDLKPLGSLLDLGRGQAISGIEFLDTRAYAVMGREGDPLLGVDLAEPTKPERRGELKVAGAGAYLHAIDAERLLTVSKDGSQARLTLYSVKPGAAPDELARYSLDEYWPDVQGTHQAFLLDAQHQAFFLPGARGGYLMSYLGDTLGMITPVAGVRPVRGAVVNDLLFLAGEDRLTAVSASTWRRVVEVNWSGR